MLKAERLKASSSAASCAGRAGGAPGGHIRRCAVCCATQQGGQAQAPAPSNAAQLSRRQLALAALPLPLLLSTPARPARAEPAASTSTSSDTAAAPAAASSSSAPSSSLELFIDNEYQLQVPSNFAFLETPIVRVERGPQPERSPVLARFEAPGGQPGSISILTRKAQAFKQTLLQVSDISQLGEPVEVAKLVLPRGSTLLGADAQTVSVPPRETPLGLVDIPAQTYYTFDFTTPTGLHVAMAAAAKKGSVFICGASTTQDRWSEAGPVFTQVVRSFRVRNQAAIS